MSQSQQTDSDSARVEDVLRSSSRSPRDPDVELFDILTKLERENGYIGAFLEQLVRDANLD